MQGLSLPSPSVCASEPLHPPRLRPSSPPPPPQQPHPLVEPVDTEGQAKVKSTGGDKAVPTSVPTSEPPRAVSRTTEWRRRKAAAAATALSNSTGPAAPARSASTEVKTEVKRKQYSCRVCGRPMQSEGHTQFRGQRYCPDAPGQVPKEEWLSQKKTEAAAKAAAKMKP